MVANILPSFLLFTQRSGAPTMTLPTNNEKQGRSCLTSTPYRYREVFADRCGLFSNVIWIDHQESLPLVAQDPTCSTPWELSPSGQPLLDLHPPADAGAP